MPPERNMLGCEAGSSVTDSAECPKSATPLANGESAEKISSRRMMGWAMAERDGCIGRGSSIAWIRFAWVCVAFWSRRPRVNERAESQLKNECHQLEGSRTVCPPMYGCNPSGTATLPSESWYCSTMATSARLVATSVELSVCTAALPSGVR